MLAGCNVHVIEKSIPRNSVPQSLLNRSGALLNDSQIANPVNTQKFCNFFNLHLFYPQSWSATGLASAIRVGPVATNILWNISDYINGLGSNSHWVVIAGIRGDGTPLGTTLYIYNPLPVNIGAKFSVGYQKLMMNLPGATYQLLQAKR